MMNTIKNAIREAVRKATFYFIIIVTLTVATSIESNAKTAKDVSSNDRNAINAYIKRTYGNKYKVRIIKGGTEDNKLTSRKGKRIIYIEQFQTISQGKTGIVRKGNCKGFVVGYATRQRKNRKVTTYIIYSPNSNAMDGIQAIVTKGKVK